MTEKFIHDFYFEDSFFKIYILTFFYFLFLYAVIGQLFLGACKFLDKRNLVSQIIITEITDKNLTREIKYSFQSIIVFGLSGVAIVFFFRKGIIELLPDSTYNTIAGVIILTLWNEVHFFIIHRLMHLPFFYRNIHKIHHQSKIPTVYAVYSFHWLEAFLLSTVPLTIAPFLNFSPMALGLYPFASILLNLAGHCNYRFGNGKGKDWKLFASRHSQHHFKNTGNFGFASNLFDRLISYKKKSKK